MILVTGATGNVGSQVVRELIARGGPVRAFVRDEPKARNLFDGVDLVLGDFEDRASIAQALDDVEAVFLASADGPSKVSHETAVIDAAAAAGVRFLVKCSTMHARAASPLAPFDWHGQIEDHLQASGIPSTILQSNFYMSNILAGAEQVRQDKKLIAPASRGQIAMIHPRDVASVAAAVLTSSGHEGATYQLTGPEALSYTQLAESLSAVTGSEIEFIDVSDDAARAALVASRMPGWLVEHLIALFGLIRGGELEMVTGVVKQLTAREPRSFADFALEHKMFFSKQNLVGNAI